MPSKLCGTRAENLRLNRNCRTVNSCSRSATLGRDCRLGVLTRSFPRFSRPNRKAAEWGWPSVVPLWSRMVAVCGQPPTTDEVQPFISPCRPRYRSHRVWLPVLLELGVLGFGLSIDGKIGVGIFPNVKEFFVGFAGGCLIAHQSLCPTELKPGQRTRDVAPAQTRIVDQLLELARCRSALA